MTRIVSQSLDAFAALALTIITISAFITAPPAQSTAPTALATVQLA